MSILEFPDAFACALRVDPVGWLMFWMPSGAFVSILELPGAPGSICDHSGASGRELLGAFVSILELPGAPGSSCEHSGASGRNWEHF